ncbi:hypothetical protein VTN02DRAFT_2556 [Thermoascus thermophilus]
MHGSPLHIISEQELPSSMKHLLSLERLVMLTGVDTQLVSTMLPNFIPVRYRPSTAWGAGPQTCFWD